MLFLLFGTNIDKDNVQLVDWLKKYGLLSNVMLLGFQADVAALFAASDIYAMSSTSEGLPISLIEAMACGAIPVCTDAGDIKIVVGSSGLVVPQKDTTKLAAAMLEIAGLSEKQRLERSKSAVQIVGKSYNIESVAQRYFDVLLQASSGSTTSPRF